MLRHAIRSGLLLGLLVSLVLSVPAAAAAAGSKPSLGVKVADVVLVRPLSFVGWAISTGVCIGTLPLTFPTGLSYGATEWMIVAPWRFTGGRPLGEFDRYIDGRAINSGY